MKCDKCSNTFAATDITKHKGENLCEDCLIDALSPARPCDPWAVHSAKSLSGEDVIFTKRQKAILTRIKNTGTIAPEELASEMKIPLSQLQLEIATLRHMEKVRMTLENNRKVLCTWAYKA